jgi:plastocyanin
MVPLSYSHFRFSPVLFYGLIGCMLASPTLGASLAVRVNNPAGTPVADAAVYARPIAPLSPADVSVTEVTPVVQIDREFVPYLTIVPVGASVEFPNRDRVRHHVYSFSKAKSFEIQLYSGRSPRQILFDKPGVVTLGCNIHDWMIAYILVVDTPYFAKTDKYGIALIKDLPKGQYQISVWHPGQRDSVPDRRWEVEAAPTAQLVLTIDTVPRKQKYKPPRETRDY